MFLKAYVLNIWLPVKTGFRGKTLKMSPFFPDVFTDFFVDACIVYVQATMCHSRCMGVNLWESVCLYTIWILAASGSNSGNYTANAFIHQAMSQQPRWRRMNETVTCLDSSRGLFVT